MGRFCRICSCVRSNESFSGKGHSKGICKKCQKRPKNEIREIEIFNELLNFWEQSNISTFNIKRLRELLDSSSEKNRKLAQLTLDVALVKPHKKRRMKWLKRHNYDLYTRVVAYFGPPEYEDRPFVSYDEEDSLDLPDDPSIFDSEHPFPLEFYLL